MTEEAFRLQVMTGEAFRRQAMTEEAFRGTLYYRFAMKEYFHLCLDLGKFHESVEYKEYFELYLNDIEKTLEEIEVEVRESWANEISNAFHAFSNRQESK